MERDRMKVGHMVTFALKDYSGQVQWHTLLILATWEVEIGRIKLQGYSK
jgi:hypothetical protein